MKTACEVTARRSTWPDTISGGRPGGAMRPTIGTSARLPPPITAASRGSSSTART